MRAPDSQSNDPSAPERPEFRRAHLATIFLQAAYPLTTSEVVAQVYNNPTNLELGRKPLSLDSARRAMKRDIDALKACGLIIVPAGKTDDGQALWQVDRAHSFTQGVALSEVDAVILDIACLPLLDDPGFAERDELRLALAKIDRLFDAAASDALTASSERDSKVLVTVRDALNARRALDIVYTTRDGSEKQRAMSRLRDPVGTVSTFIFVLFSPRRMTAPLPYCFSIWLSAASSARSASTTSPSRFRTASTWVSSGSSPSRSVPP